MLLLPPNGIFVSVARDGRVAEEDAGGDLLHLVELHLGDGQLLRLGSGLSADGVHGEGERGADAARSARRLSMAEFPR